MLAAQPEKRLVSKKILTQIQKVCALVWIAGLVQVRLGLESNEQFRP
jgi:hypothetical protein